MLHISWYDGTNECKVTDLTINYRYFIIGQRVKDNQSLSKIKGDVRAKEKEFQQITGKYSKNISPKPVFNPLEIDKALN